MDIGSSLVQRALGINKCQHTLAGCSSVFASCLLYSFKQSYSGNLSYERLMRSIHIQVARPKSIRCQEVKLSFIDNTSNLLCSLLLSNYIVCTTSAFTFYKTITMFSTRPQPQKKSKYVGETLEETRHQKKGMEHKFHVIQ